jgi:hypothetical protein
MRAPGTSLTVYAQPLSRQAMQWEVERFYLRVGGEFLCLTDPRGILLLIRERQDLSVYLSETGQPNM